MISWLRSLRFSTKLIILSLVPTLITFLLGAQVLQSKFTELTQLSRLEFSIKQSLLLDNVAHQHAIERDLSAGYLGSAGQTGQAELKKQRLNANEAWENFTSHNMLRQTQLQIDPTESYRFKLESLIASKKEIQKQVDVLAPQNSAFSYYSELNMTALNMIEVIAQQITDPELANDFFTYRNLLIAKENAGKIRGGLNNAFKANTLSIRQRATIQSYIVNQNQHFVKAVNNASDNIAKKIDKLNRSDAYGRVSNVLAIIADDQKNIDAIDENIRKNWFALATANIQSMKHIADTTASRLTQSLSNAIDRTNTSLYIGALALSVLIIIVISLTWWQIKDLSARVASIRNLLYSVFSKGDLTLRSHDNATDEIGTISSTLNDFLDNIQSLVTDIKKICVNLQAQSDSVSRVTERNMSSVDSQREQTQLLASAITEMSASFSEVARSTHDAEQAATEAQKSSTLGKESVNQTSLAVTRLSNEIEKAEHTIKEVSENCNRIGSILDTIRGIAEQTNLLALNAAIEAARAGEQGRGFAVVADEVRSLAQRTQESTEEINNMINALQQSSVNARDTMTTSRSVANDCLKYASDSGNSIELVDETINQVHNLSIQIAAATEEQTAVSNEVTQNIISISSTAELISDAAEEIEQGGHTLRDMATNLNNKVDRYQV